jgi:hypothetical protein
VSNGSPGPTFERFKDGWVVVDRAGVIATPSPMPEQTARAYARVLRVPFPEDDQSEEDPEAVRKLLGTATGSAVRYLDFVLELAPYVTLWQRMQDEHVPTPQGFCAARGCGRGGYGTPCLPWPCPTRRLADWAWGAHHRRSANGQQPE